MRLDRASIFPKFGVILIIETCFCGISCFSQKNHVFQTRGLIKKPYHRHRNKLAQVSRQIDNINVFSLFLIFSDFCKCQNREKLLRVHYRKSPRAPTATRFKQITVFYIFVMSKPRNCASGSLFKSPVAPTATRFKQITVFFSSWDPLLGTHFPSKSAENTVALKMQEHQ